MTTIIRDEGQVLKVNQRRHGVGFWLARGLIGLVVAVIALLASGALYEVVAAPGDADRFPAPGMLYEVNGHPMHLYCTGEGSPTVILEAGANDWSSAWALTQPEIAATTRVCSYDRAGYGWSESTTVSHSPSRIAEDLHTLLDTAGVEPPFVLVGHSMGGKMIRLFADLYPAETAGLVFVDARHESAEPVGLTEAENLRNREAYASSLNFYRVFRDLGIVRVFGVGLAGAMDPSLTNIPAEILYPKLLQAVRESTLQTMLAEGSSGMADDEALRAARSLDRLPIIVLTANSSLETEGWREAQAKLAALSANSDWQIVADSGHNIHAEHPDIVATAVARVIDAVQSGEALN